MLLKILGSGTCAISLKRSSPANFLKIGDKQILVDCGPGTLLQLEKAGLSYKEIDMVFLTHFHTDHISDLNALIWAYKWGNLNRKKDLTIIGPAGFRKYYEAFIKPLVWEPPARDFNLIIKEIDTTLDCQDFVVQSCKTVHTDESIAYNFLYKGKSLVISGDTEFCEDLIAFSHGCDVLMLECSFNDTVKVPGHLTPTLCGEIAKQARVKKLILTHLYPDYSDDKRLSEARKLFVETFLAEDLMECTI